MASNLRTLFDEGFAYPKLTDWLDWVSVGEGEQFVALPMLQRNAVWKPQQIITLWDSLLRGMPVGSLMLTELKPHSEVLVRRVGSREAIPLPPTGGAALVDGQQRTLAMLLGWQRTQGSAMGGANHLGRFCRSACAQSSLSHACHQFGLSVRVHKIRPKQSIGAARSPRGNGSHGVESSTRVDG